MLQILTELLSSSPSQVPPSKKRCIVCGEWFYKRRNIMPSQWTLQKTCSHICRDRKFYSDKKRATYIHTGNGVKWRFICSICGEVIIGSKKDIQRHKFERHSM